MCWNSIPHDVAVYSQTLRFATYLLVQRHFSSLDIFMLVLYKNFFTNNRVLPRLDHHTHNINNTDQNHFLFIGNYWPKD